MHQTALERRTESRVNRPVEMTYRASSAGYRRSLAVDVSPGGAQILTYDEEEISAEVQLTLLLEPDCNLTVVGRPMWEEPLENGICRVGLSFSSVGLGGRAYLEGWVNRNSA